jgi:hypothetical protein
MCIWLFKLDNPLPLLIGGGIAALVVLTEAARWAFGRTKAA